MINSTGCPRSPGGTTGAMVRGCTGRMTPGLGMARYIIIDPYRGLQKWEIYSGLVDILWYFDAFWCILIAKNDDSPMDLSFFFPNMCRHSFLANARPYTRPLASAYPKADMLFFSYPWCSTDIFSDQTVSDWSICSEPNHINHWSDQSPWPSGSMARPSAGRKSSGNRRVPSQVHFWVPSEASEFRLPNFGSIFDDFW